MRPRNEYGQAPPTERDAVEALGDLVGSRVAEGIWESSARTLGLVRPVVEPADLRRMADHLMNIGGLMRVAGRSTKVRVATYEALSRSEQA